MTSIEIPVRFQFTLPDVSQFDGKSGFDGDLDMAIEFLFAAVKDKLHGDISTLMEDCVSDLSLNAINLNQLGNVSQSEMAELNDAFRFDGPDTEPPWTS